MDREECMAHFGVPDLSKVEVRIVMEKKRQVIRRRNYTCGYRVVDVNTGDAYCSKVYIVDNGMKRCIDVPLSECPFIPMSIKTKRLLKPRYIE